ncbi:hypothetical protein R69608_03268 [Paraburkholderia nemoris]|uniref:hypothetical protein n=1 Tax=Paraburkholderia nemoris TaxID=2793076 RepID=UPI001912365D|nr:hypothetical protein [Paraburkholderia nemoris]MBK5148592.1 hypothetical protein [Burkholderia sp. R-69608]CAE6906865.1 hypothetical protein R69608_03268 [Paraburkholderia nemoris]
MDQTSQPQLVSEQQSAAILEFLRNGGISPVHVGLEVVILATNYACIATDSLWNNVDSQAVLDALDAYSSDFRSEQDATYPGGYDEFSTRVREAIAVYGFFEHCAFLLLSIPRKARPKDAQKRFDAIRREMERSGDMKSIEVLEELGIAIMPKVAEFMVVLQDFKP